MSGHAPGVGERTLYVVGAAGAGATRRRQRRRR
jgi:hypothetical protein